MSDHSQLLRFIEMLTNHRQNDFLMRPAQDASAAQRFGSVTAAGVMQHLVPLMIILLAPIGVFALISRTFATQGIEIFGPLVGYFILVAVILVLHLLLTYSAILRLSGMNPVKFLTQMRAPMSFAFSTSSS